MDSSWAEYSVPLPGAFPIKPQVTLQEQKYRHISYTINLCFGERELNRQNPAVRGIISSGLTNPLRPVLLEFQPPYGLLTAVNPGEGEEDAKDMGHGIRIRELDDSFYHAVIAPSMGWRHARMVVLNFEPDNLDYSGKFWNFDGKMRVEQDWEYDPEAGYQCLGATSKADGAITCDIRNNKPYDYGTNNCWQFGQDSFQLIKDAGWGMTPARAQESLANLSGLVKMCGIDLTRFQLSVPDSWKSAANGPPRRINIILFGFFNFKTDLAFLPGAEASAMTVVT